MERFDYLKAYYDLGREDGRLLSRHGSVEFLTTVHYIEKYLRQGMNILEIGAGTGRYSHYFARGGYTVDAVELIESNIEAFKKNTEAGERISIVQGDATHLDAFEDERYDITLLLGPMYHLYTEEDQKKALSEALRVTKTGGIVFAAYCNNDATMISFCFMKNTFKEYFSRGMIDPESFKCKSTPKEIFSLYRKEEIDSLMQDLPAERLHYIGTDMASNFIKGTVDAMDDETFAQYLRYHLSICERADMVGVTHHMLDIFQKAGTLASKSRL